MALDRASKKKVALKVAGEIKNVLSDHNGARLLAKHKAKKATAPAPAPQDDEDLEAALGQPDDETTEGEMPMAPPKKQGFPFSKAGGGMRGRGLKRGG